MQYNESKGNDGLMVRNSRRLAWKRIVFVMGCIVVFCTTYALILPAITMEIPTYCGFIEHIHTDECYRQITSENKIVPIPAESNPNIHHHTEMCYDEFGTLICGEADFVVHTHDESCYDTDGNLWCTLPEISLHIHDESCNIPQDSENEFHIHTDECYELRKKYICGFDAPETDIFGNEITGGAASGLTMSTDEGFFPAPPADEFASGEVTTVPDDAASESTMPELSSPAAEPTAEPVVTEPISESAVTEPFSEDLQADANVSGILQSEATIAQTNDYGFDGEIPGFGETMGDTVTAAPIHVHTEDCYVYEKVLICTKAVSSEITETGENAFELLPVVGDGFGFIDNQETPIDTIGVDELSVLDVVDNAAESDNLGSSDDFVISDMQNNTDELDFSNNTDVIDIPEDFGEPVSPDEALNQDWLGEPDDGSEAYICTLPEVILHEHDYSCYNESGELICGMLAVRAHQHSPECEGICYITEEVPIDETALTCGIPEGEGAHLHSFENGCFDENMNIICPMEESLGHIHDIHCYGKWELICGMEEHEHTEECEIDPDAEEISLDDEIMMLAEEGVNWGYELDGSIYWDRSYGLHQIPFESIEVNTPYLFLGPNSVSVMTKESYTYYEHEYRQSVKYDQISDYSLYQYWCFESANESNSYYIYCNNDNGTKSYLKFGQSNCETEWTAQWSTSTATELIVTENKSEATVFIVQKSGNEVYIKSGNTYINSYSGDKDVTTHWWGHADSCKIKLLGSSAEKRANRLPTVVSSNTTINLFDYWVSTDVASGRFDSDNNNDEPMYGINNGHTLLFTRKGQGRFNEWVGAGRPPYQNIVANTLGEDGYPFLSQVTTGSTESLAYLFNPDHYCPGKASYTNVNGLLRNDAQGYFYFDCKETMAEYNEADNNIYIYDKPGVVSHSNEDDIGMFFPFNNAPQIMETTCNQSPINHYFGMTITTRFFQKNGGYTNESSEDKIPTSFHFSGDDDVWIFIDDVLVGDGGGIHDASSIDIDFVTGKVYINNSETTTLLKAYQAAGKQDSTKWSEVQSNTFADNTTHTLKFFYLERGNYSSNLELKYNLISIPKTAIYKVDQYGQVVPGAEFAVYAADSSYNMLSGRDGNVVTEPQNPVYDANGNLTDDNGSIIAYALYTGTTNAAGEMIFENKKDGTPYTINELEDLFGKNFILREIKVPDGFRVVTKDVYLEIWDGSANGKILKCNNTAESGSRAASTLQVTAPETIFIKNGDNTSEKIDYYSVKNENGNVTTTHNGTMFAIVLKYTGPIDNNGNATDLNIESNWTPVYGNDKIGYTLVDMTGITMLDAVLYAANKTMNDGDEVVFKVSPSCQMQLTLENLPGNITEYYRMLSKSEKGKTRYTVGFYWTDADSLVGANTSNTHGVYSHRDELDVTEFKSFERAFGANIQVPNLINKIFVQKMDGDKLINGATFAIYKVHQDETKGDIRYIDSNNINHLLDGEYTINSETGIINGSDFTINPVAVTTTSTLSDGIHVGTGEFVNLNDGQYIVKEIKSPVGYALNDTDIMVLVTEDTIYANAGTEDDGVMVGRGPGYIVNTLSQFASEGQIDNTLTWIYAQMRISNPSTSFYDVEDESKMLGYIAVNESSTTNNDPHNGNNAFKTYLKYKPSEAVQYNQVAFNYYPNPDRHNDDADKYASYRRIFTTSGWPYYELWQDYEFGSKQVFNTSINYEDWSQNEITHLFSRSTYIRVTDEQDVSLDVNKINSENNQPLAEAKFVLYRKAISTNGVEITEYYKLNDSGAVEWVPNKQDATIASSKADGSLDKAFAHISGGTYYLEEIQSPAGFALLAHPVEVTVEFYPELAVTASIKNAEGTNSRQLEFQTIHDEAANHCTFKITVANTCGHELPSTGGSGTEVYTVSGISIIALAIVLAAIKRRKTV